MRYLTINADYNWFVPRINLFKNEGGNIIEIFDFEEGDNIFSIEALNMENWSINKNTYEQCFYDWGYSEENFTTSFKFKGVGGWETIYFKITELEQNADYVWQWRFKMFNNLTTSDNTIRALPCAILTTDPSTTNDFSGSSNGSTDFFLNWRGLDLASIIIPFTASEVNEDPEGYYSYIPFNSKTYTTVYICYNFGLIYDSQIWDIQISQQMLSEGTKPKIFKQPSQL